MKIVVVGSQGFIGQPLVAKLAQRHEVISWELPVINVTIPQTFLPRLKKLRPDLVVNLAAILGDMNSKNINEIMYANCQGNLNLIEACAQFGIKRYVFASSLTVHGENDPRHPCVLTTPFSPKHPYSASKAAAEFTLMQYARLKSVTIAAVRPVSIIGDTYMNHAPIDFVRTLLNGETIKIYGSGNHEREWLWIDDVVTGFYRAIQYLSRQRQGYHPLFLGGNRISMTNLAAAAVKILGGSIDHIDHQAQAFTLTCDMAETQQKLSWLPQSDINRILHKTISLLQSNQAANLH